MGRRLLGLPVTRSTGMPRKGRTAEIRGRPRNADATRLEEPAVTQAARPSTARMDCPPTAVAKAEPAEALALRDSAGTARTQRLRNPRPGPPRSASSMASLGNLRPARSVRRGKPDKVAVAAEAKATPPEEPAAVVPAVVAAVRAATPAV